MNSRVDKVLRSSLWLNTKTHGSNVATLMVICVAVEWTGTMTLWWRSCCVGTVEWARPASYLNSLTDKSEKPTSQRSVSLTAWVHFHTAYFDPVQAHVEHRDTLLYIQMMHFLFECASLNPSFLPCALFSFSFLSSLSLTHVYIVVYYFMCVHVCVHVCLCVVVEEQRNVHWMKTETLRNACPGIVVHCDSW